MLLIAVSGLVRHRASGVDHAWSRPGAHPQHERHRKRGGLRGAVGHIHPRAYNLGGTGSGEIEFAMFDDRTSALF